MKTDFAWNRWLSRAALAAALACLAAGLPRAGYAWGGGFLLASLALWAAGRRWKWDWVPGACLAGYTAAAAGSLLAGAPFDWMAAGTAAALAAFELAGGEQGLGTNAAAHCRFQNRRALLLGAAVAAGFAAALAGSRLDFNIPFGGLGLAALAVLFGLYRLNGLFKP